MVDDEVFGHPFRVMRRIPGIARYPAVYSKQSRRAPASSLEIPIDVSGQMLCARTAILAQARCDRHTFGQPRWSFLHSRCQRHGGDILAHRFDMI